MSFEFVLCLVLGLGALLIVIANDWTKRLATERAERRRKQPRDYGPSRTDWKMVIALALGFPVIAWVIANPREAKRWMHGIEGFPRWLVVGSVAGLFGAILAMRQFWVGISQLRAALLARSWAIAPGRIITSRLTNATPPSAKATAEPKGAWVFEVDYEYVVDGQMRRGARLVVGNPLGFTITTKTGLQLTDLMRAGADVKVLYNPKNPSECGVLRLSPMWSLLNFGLGFLLLTPLLIVGGYLLMKGI